MLVACVLRMQYVFIQGWTHGFQFETFLRKFYNFSVIFAEKVGVQIKNLTVQYGFKTISAPLHHKYCKLTFCYTNLVKTK